jgi:transglutaminase-like putative cysteine protease
MRLWPVLLLIALEASALEIYDLDYLVLDSNISARMNIIDSGLQSRVQNVKVYLAFYPTHDGRQEVLRQSIFPDYQVQNDTLLFSWKRPDAAMGIKVDSKVKISGHPVRLFTKVNFPLTDINQSLRPFILPSETIDSHVPQIKELASQLAAGEDDEAVVVHKMAVWTHKNIKYDLNSITAEATQKASWVLENKEGVCDEITNLFIALCRAVGIPARFVSGISYTTSEQFEEPWSPHGWAEVYFPGYGWVPYDVTYGEFGYVNPTHLALKKSVDSNRSSTRYEWEGYNAKLETSNLLMKTVVNEEGPLSRPDITLSARVLKKATGFDSYNLVIAEATNLRDYYISRQISVSETEEISIIAEGSQFILLGPKETKTLYWMMKTEGDLDPRYVYSFRIGVYSQKNESAIANFTSTSRDKTYGLQEIREYHQSQIQADMRVYSKKVDLACSPIKGYYYADEDAEIKCTITNLGNVALENLSVCLEKRCTTYNLGISESSDSYFLVTGEAGIKEIMATAENTQVSKVEAIQVEFLDKPIIEIEDITFPDNISVDKPFALEFKLSRKSSSVPQNVKVKISGGIQKDLYIDQMHEDRKFIVNVDSYTISNEDFMIGVVYEDQLGRKYVAKDDFTVNMSPQTSLQKITMILNKMDILTGILIVVSVVTFLVVTEIILYFKRRGSDMIEKSIHGKKRS